MLENLFNLIKEQGVETVINNPIVPNAQNNQVLAEATHAVASGFQSEIAGGGLQNVLGLFNSGSNQEGGIAGLLNNPMVSNIINGFKDKLSGNHGIESGAAGNIANSLIPNVLSNLISKTNDPNDNSFDINGIIGSLTGGNTGGLDIQGLLGKFTGGGLDSNGDGNVGLDDIMNKITGGNTQPNKESGGLMDMIQGFLK